MDRRQLLQSLAALAAAGPVLSACSAQQETQGGSGGGQAKVFKIGVYCPLTGELAENGQNFKRSFELFAEDANAKQALGDTKIELVIRDDKGEPKTAANIAQEYSQDSSIDATLGSFSSTAAMAAAPVLVKAGIPNICPTSSHPDYTGLGRGLYRGTDTQKIEAAFVAEHMVTKLNAKKIAIVFRQDDWGVSAAQNFEDKAKQLGVQVVGKQGVAPESRDLRSVVTTLQNSGADSLYVALQYSDAATMAQQMAAASWKPVVATATSLYSQKLLELAAAAVEGWNVSTFFFAQSTKPIIAEYVKAYHDKYQRDPDGFAAVAYDSIRVLVKAKQGVPQSGKDGRAKLVDAIYQTTLDGVTGTIKFDAHGDVEKPVSWLVVQNGKFAEAK